MTITRLDTFRAAALSGLLAHDSNRTTAETSRLAEQHAQALERAAADADAKRLDEETKPRPSAPAPARTK